MTLARPVAGQSLFDSDGAGTLSTVMFDSYADAIEALQGSVSSHIITTDAYTDTTEVLLNNADSLTGWHAIGSDVVDPNPGPLLSSDHSQGVSSVQAYLKGPSGAANVGNSLYVNLTEVGYAAGLTVEEGQVLIIDYLLQDTSAYSPFTNAFTNWAVTAASGVDMTGTVVQSVVTATQAEGLVLDTWYTVHLNVGALTNIKSIGIKKVSSSQGSSAQRARWQVDNVRLGAHSALDKAYNSASAVTVMVPSSYQPTIEQSPIQPTPLRSIVDFRTDHAFISGLGGVRNIREWALDETGETEVGINLQNALDSLEEDTILVFPSTAVFRCDNGLIINNNRITIDGQGAAIIQGDPTSIYDGVSKVAVSTEMRMQIFGDDVAVRNLRIFGTNITPNDAANGSILSAATSTMEVSTLALTGWSGAGVSLDTTNPRNGSKHLTTTAASTAATATGLSGIPIAPSTSYTMGAYVRGLSVSTGNTIAIQWYSSSGSLISTSTSGTFTTSATTYTQQTLTATSPSTAVYAALVVTAGTNAVFIDDATFGLTTAQWTLAGGATPSGSDALLSGNGSNISRLAALARDHLGRIRIDVVLSDSTVPHVANDFQIVFTDTDGFVLSTENLTLTSTPTVHTFYATLRNLYAHVNVVMSKTTATTNTITVGNIRMFNNLFTTWIHSNPALPNWEFCHGLQLAGNNNTVEDITVEGVTGDGTNIPDGLASEQSNTIQRRIMVRGNGRQAFCINGGSNHRLEDVIAIYPSRHGVDFEPEFVGTTSVDKCDIRNMVIWESALVPAFQSGMPSGGMARVRNVTVDGLRIYRTGGGFIGGAFLNSRFANLELRDPSNPVVGNGTTQLYGHNNVWDGVIIEEAIQVGVSAGLPTSTDEFGTVYTVGGAMLRNCVFKTTQPAGYIDVQAPNTHLENIRVEPNLPVVDITQNVGTMRLLSDTTYHNVDFLPNRLSLPVSFPGVAMGQPWFPRGLDMRDETLSRVRALSGGTTKGNNLGRFGVALSAGSTTSTVTFPTKTYQQFASFSIASGTGGTMSAGTYYYRVSARPVRGGPLLALAEKSVVLTSGTAVNITGTTVASLVSGILISGMTIYRGVSTGTYNTRYDIVPTGEFSSWSSTLSTMVVIDQGTVVAAGGAAGQYSGFAFPYAQNNTNTAPIDETGYEPDVNYAVFVETSWETTYRCSAKRTNGFDLEFGTPAPTTGGTFSYMVARF